MNMSSVLNITDDLLKFKNPKDKIKGLTTVHGRKLYHGCTKITTRYQSLIQSMGEVY